MSSLSSFKWREIQKDKRLYNSLVVTDKMLKATQSKPELEPYNPGACVTLSLSTAIVAIGLTSMINN